MKTNLLFSTALLAMGYGLYASSNNATDYIISKDKTARNSIEEVTGGVPYNACTYFTKDTVYIGKDSISGLVYNFQSSSKRVSDNENVMGGIPEQGVLVTIYSNTGVQIASTITNYNGQYRINKLSKGNYNLVASKGNSTLKQAVTLDGNPSTATSADLDMTNAITGLMNGGEDLSNQFTLYPTMVKDFVIIDLGSLPKTDELVNISIVNSLGKVVINNNYTGNSLVEISTLGLESGNYIARISKGKIVGNKKFVKVN